MALAPDALVYARVDLIDVDGQPTLMELELIEPDLFLRMAPGSVERFAAAVAAALVPAADREPSTSRNDHEMRTLPRKS